MKSGRTGGALMHDHSLVCRPQTERERYHACPEGRGLLKYSSRRKILSLPSSSLPMRNCHIQPMRSLNACPLPMDFYSKQSLLTSPLFSIRASPSPLSSNLTYGSSSFHVPYCSCSASPEQTHFAGKITGLFLRLTQKMPRIQIFQVNRIAY